jgi:hypothetical protein
MKMKWGSTFLSKSNAQQNGSKKWEGVINQSIWLVKKQSQKCGAVSLDYRRKGGKL